MLKSPYRAPRIDAAVFATRRQQLLDRMDDGDVLILPAPAETVRNSDVHHPFRQDSSVRYLTGFPEPEAVVVLRPGAEAAYTLFCRPRDPHLETWNGRRVGPQGAIERYGAEAAYPLAELDTRMPALLAGCRRIFYPFGVSDSFDTRVRHWLAAARPQGRRGVRVPDTLADSTPLIARARLFKDSVEVELMAEAGRISSEAHRAAMRCCRPGLYEYQVQAELEHVFGWHGAAWAYPSIVAGGVNATILHYVENDQRLNAGELLLIDAGCELAGYAADITRTFPIDGRFTTPQRDLYAVVLAAQDAALAAVAPGRPYNDFHDAAVGVLVQGLVDLGLLPGPVDARIEDGSYQRFYMHRTGHWLGLDVHDVGAYRDEAGDWTRLAAGMVVTVEPGLYIPEDADDVPAHWRGMGIRIEDDALLTDDGHRLLTRDAPKRIEDIEALMAEGP